MKTKIIVGVLLGVLLIGILSAGLIDYFGRITGSAEVEGPVFYTAPGDKLLINEKPLTSGTPTIDNTDSQIFETEKLEGIDFNYIPTANFYVRAKVNNPPQNLTLIFGYEDTDNNYYQICSSNVTIQNSSLKNYSLVSCSGTLAPSDIKKIYYEVKGNCEDCKYGIRHFTGEFYSRIEISAT